MKGLLETVARALVDAPEDVKVHMMEGSNGRVLYEIEVAQEDLGKIIGRDGRVIKAIRTLAKASALRSGKKVQVELCE